MDSSSARPTAWEAARDEAFFRIVKGLFPPALLEAASVLLASYDDACAVADRRAGLPTTDRRSSRRQPAWPLPYGG